MLTGSRNAWGVTAVDTLSVAIILKDRESVNQIVEFVPTIDFTTTALADEQISLFETNIRYFGGLLSGTSARLRQSAHC
jgi:mannosyl-oligosaccharide alpha-1,2-mannosidase